MITLKKGDAVKVLDPESKLIERLLADGWKAEKPKKEKEPKKKKGE